MHHPWFLEQNKVWKSCLFPFWKFTLRPDLNAIPLINWIHSSLPTQSENYLLLFYSHKVGSAQCSCHVFNCILLLQLTFICIPLECMFLLEKVFDSFSPVFNSTPLIWKGFSKRWLEWIRQREWETNVCCILKDKLEWWHNHRKALEIEVYEK